MNQFIKPVHTGFQFLLVVLLNVFAATAFAADCKVNDSGISGEYVGDCVEGFAHGKGKTKGKDSYEGEFKQGKKHGRGSYTWAVGAKYEGNWVNDKMTGEGLFIGADGYKYEGNWLDNAQHGQGTGTSLNGVTYAGETVKGVRSGFGVMTLPRKVFHSGKFVDSGKWVKDNYELRGLWKNNELVIACASANLKDCEQELASGTKNLRNTEVINNFGSTYIRKDLMCNNPKYYADRQGPGYHYSNFQLTPEGTAIDPRTGLEWRRCLVGQTFNKGICSKDVGTKTDYVTSFKVASEDRTGGYSDWRIPQFEEVKTLASDGCQPKVNPAIFSPSFYPNGDFWWAYFWVDLPALTSNRLYEMERDTHPHAFVGHYSDDSSYDRIASRSDRLNLRLVRGGSSDKYGHFTNLLAAANDITAKRLVLAQEKLEKEIVEQKRYAAEKAAEQQRIAAEEKKFQAILNDKNPQTIYLAAGSYERNGEGGKASQIYEAIIAKFPSSSWAVKANDQLNEAKRSNDAQSAANQRQYNAQRANESAAQDAASKSRSQCSYRIDKCEDSCRPLSGSSKSACWSSCKSLCNQF